MSRKTLTVHQFTPSVTVGDGVSNALFFTQKILRDLGFDGEIFAKRIDERLAGKVKHIDDYSPSKDQLLLYHHSIGHEHHDKILSFADKKILVYHNITPSHFFELNPHLKGACENGRRQLASSAGRFAAAYADSPYNAKELISLGYKNVEAIPILLNIDDRKNAPFNEETLKEHQSTYNIITVGRVVSNKAQHEVINAVFYLREKYWLRNIRLFIIGGVSEGGYDEYLKTLVKNLSLEETVIFTGKVSDEELHSYYKCADLFLTLSNHEGFCIPLIEAMLTDTPVLAYSAGGISSTVPSPSLLYFKSPEFAASKIFEIVNNAHLRHEMIKAQKEHLENFSYENIVSAFVSFLASFGIGALAIRKQGFNLAEKDEDKSPFPNNIGSEVLTSPSNEDRALPPYYGSKVSTPLLGIAVEGPFDSSYSLSIVNQNMALSLSKNNSVSLCSTEGMGDFKPNEHYLRSHPDIDALYRNEQDDIDVTIRNLYPPRANAMRGAHKIIGPYGWEESEFLPEYVWQFNSRLTMLFCMSDYVKDIMANNGVKVPSVTLGLGADHVLKTSSKQFAFDLPEGKKLLHISSCFPRKGADVLLEAFDELVKEHKELALIVKTFPNPHNDIAELIGKTGFAEAKRLEENVSLYEKDSSYILLINKDLEQSYINYLYENSDIFVAPTRGEGFGLPQAEAMLFGLPVVTTAYGGQSDFCTPETSWLIDFEFDYAKTHMDLPRSLWAEPSKQSLLQQMDMLLRTPKEELESKLSFAKEHILSNHTWHHAAQRAQDAINNYETLKKPKPKIGVVSTFNTKCGIAEYSKYLISGFDKADLKIFASFEDSLVREDEPYVMRCWQSGENSSQDLALLKHGIVDAQISSLVIQYNFSFFTLALLEELLNFCHDREIRTYLFIHSAKDVVLPDVTKSFAQIASSLKNATRIMLHSLDDMNLLKSFGIYKNTALFAHGYDTSLIETADIKSALLTNVDGSKPLIASFGFLLPHKGVMELIKAAEILHRKGVSVQLLLLNAIHPAPVSEHEKNIIADYLSTSPVKESVFMHNDFLDDKEILSLLRESRMVVYPYQNTQESSSAAARFGLLSLRPVLTTPLSIFEDIKHISFQTKDTTPDKIAKSIEHILSHGHDGAAQRKWVEQNSWGKISQRFYGAIEALQ